MNYSTNYNLNKPERNEQFNIDHWNNNTDAIDSQMHTNEVNIAQNATNIATLFTGLNTKNTSDADSVFYKLMKLIYPVGSLYWSSNPTNPGDLFGGTWVQIKDRFVLACGDTYTIAGATGGSKTVRLTESNLPAHKHSFSGTTGNVSGTGSAWYHSHITGSAVDDPDYPAFNYYGCTWISTRSESIRGQSTDAHYLINTNSVNLQHTHSFSGKTDDGNGTASAINILPPYITKFCWERTA